ncbi:MAG TPA: hypothetical protein VF482_01985 [Trebonia sp.]
MLERILREYSLEQCFGSILSESSYRDRDQVEVDMVLEHTAGTVIGIEVKAAEPETG